jgi:hypothetical protein
VRIRGNETTKRYILPVNSEAPKSKEEFPNPMESVPPEDSTNASAVQLGAPSLEYGSKCIRNALYLLSRTANLNPSDDDLNLRQALLVNGAYLALATSNPAVALSYAREILSMKKINEPFRSHSLFFFSFFFFLTKIESRLFANIYAGEALCLIGKPGEAIQHFSPNALGLTDVASSVLPSSPFTSLSSEPVLNTKHILYLNLAIAFILKVFFFFSSSVALRAKTRKQTILFFCNRMIWFKLSNLCPKHSLVAILQQQLSYKFTWN